MKWRCFSGFSPVAVLVLLLLSSCGSKPTPSATLSGVNVLPLDAPVGKGLSVYYRYAFYRHLKQMPSKSAMLAEGEKGEPVLFLDHQFERNVFDGKRAKGVGVLLTGYLKMERAGEYGFMAMANDGVQVAVNGEIVVFDPAVHKDRLSDPGQVFVSDAGWYPLTVKYFQRKGTARLTLYWKPPGALEFEVVPAEAYGTGVSEIPEQ